MTPEQWQYIQALTGLDWRLLFRELINMPPDDQEQAVIAMPADWQGRFVNFTKARRLPDDAFRMFVSTREHSQWADLIGLFPERIGPLVGLNEAALSGARPDDLFIQFHGIQPSRLLGLPIELIDLIIAEFDGDITQLEMAHVSKDVRKLVVSSPGYQATRDKVQRAQTVWRGFGPDTGNLSPKAAALVLRDPEALLPSQRKRLNEAIDAMIINIETLIDDEQCATELRELSPALRLLDEQHQNRQYQNRMFARAAQIDDEDVRDSVFPALGWPSSEVYRQPYLNELRSTPLDDFTAEAFLDEYLPEIHRLPSDLHTRFIDLVEDVEEEDSNAGAAVANVGRYRDIFDQASRDRLEALARRISTPVWQQVALAGLGLLDDADLDTLAGDLGLLDDEDDRLQAAKALVGSTSGTFQQRMLSILSGLLQANNLGLFAVEALAPHWERLDMATHQRIVAEVESPPWHEHHLRDVILALDQVRHQIDPSLYARLLSAW